MFRAMSAQSASIPSTQVVQSLRRRQLAYLEALVQKLGQTRTEIARGAGVSPSTISKFENDVENMAQLGSSTMEKLVHYSGGPINPCRPSRRKPSSLRTFRGKTMFRGR